MKGHELRIPTPTLVILPILLLFLASFVLDIGGKSLGEYLGLFLLGYFVLADDEIQGRLERLRWPLIVIGATFTIAYTLLYGKVNIEPL